MASGKDGGPGMNILFLDIDGVLNCELHYRSLQFEGYKAAKKQLRKEVKQEKIDRLEYYQSQICRERMGWLNQLCKDIEAKVIISSTWRMGKTVEQLQEILSHCGAEFEIIGKTGKELCGQRGCEIKTWMVENCSKLFGKYDFDFTTYAIIDDDSDMLLEQAKHFFQTDSYSGLTPNTCYKIKRFFTNKTFDYKPDNQ